MRKICLWLICIFMVAAYSSEAQFNRRNIKKNNKKIAKYRGHKEHFGKEKIYNAIGISVNAVNYYGDLAPKPSRFSTDISFTRPGFGVSFGHRFGPRYTLMGQFMWATLKGSDKESADPSNAEYNGRYLRNLEFRNNIKELTVVAVIDLFENMATYISRVRWTPYVSGGAAVFISTPKAKAPATDLTGAALPDAGNWVKLRPLKTEGEKYSAIQFAIPLSVGARFRINEVLDLWADIGYRYTFTDYLDDVSGRYIDLDKFGDNRLAQAMSYRTNELEVGSNPGQRPAATVPSGTSGILTVGGYGSYGTGENIRGSSSAKDIYMVTSIRLTYIIGATFHKAKFR
jgi:Domain of unknown function (DUF6089)